ncbi:MAG: hypothetical protein ACPG48_06100, partial [Candidatus Puniceispirillaceae bacterium]
MTRNHRARARVASRPSPLPWMLAGAIIALALAIAAGQANAAGSDYGGSDSSGSSSSSATMSKSMRKATGLINKEDFTGALVHLETEIAANPDNAD